MTITTTERSLCCNHHDTADRAGTLYALWFRVKENEVGDEPGAPTFSNDKAFGHAMACRVKNDWEMDGRLACWRLSAG